jgi:hypothetical protein
MRTTMLRTHRTGSIRTSGETQAFAHHGITGGRVGGGGSVDSMGRAFAPAISSELMTSLSIVLFQIARNGVIFLDQE